METPTDSPAIAKTIIVIHDTMNEVELDFAAGNMLREPSLDDELLSRRGLVVVDSSRTADSLVREARGLVVDREQGASPHQGAGRPQDGPGEARNSLNSGPRWAGWRIKARRALERRPGRRG